jgi:hypothetical protein
MNDYKIDIINGQKAGLIGLAGQTGQAERGNYLSNTPYYIQVLERKIDRLEYKIDLLVGEMNKNKNGAA